MTNEADTQRLKFELARAEKNLQDARNKVIELQKRITHLRDQFEAWVKSCTDIAGPLQATKMMPINPAYDGRSWPTRKEVDDVQKEYESAIKETSDLKSRSSSS